MFIVQPNQSAISTRRRANDLGGGHHTVNRAGSQMSNDLYILQQFGAPSPMKIAACKPISNTRAAHHWRIHLIAPTGCLNSIG